MSETMSQTEALREQRREQQEEVIGFLLDFDQPKGAWRIQRRDGQFVQGIGGRANAVTLWTPDVDRAMGFLTERGAQNYIDINQGSARGRREFADCRPYCVAPLFEDGDHVVCACGQMHEADYCPTAAGHGMVL